MKKPVFILLEQLQTSKKGGFAFGSCIFPQVHHTRTAVHLSEGWFYLCFMHISTGSSHLNSCSPPRRMVLPLFYAYLHRFITLEQLCISQKDGFTFVSCTFPQVHHIRTAVHLSEGWFYLCFMHICTGSSHLNSCASLRRMVLPLFHAHFHRFITLEQQCTYQKDGFTFVLCIFPQVHHIRTAVHLSEGWFYLCFMHISTGSSH